MSFIHKNEFELDKKNSKKISDFSSNANGQLLLEAPKEDLSILNTIGLYHSVQEILDKKNDIDALIGLRKIYDSPVYLASDIKEICFKYNLRILKTDYYKGEIDLNAAKAIKKFSENNKQHVNLGVNNFFVLAPTEDFFYPNKLSSCTIFYRETNNSCNVLDGDKLIKVYSWGKNYSEFRQLDFMFISFKSDFIDSYACVTYNLIALSLLIFVFCMAIDQALANLIVLTLIWSIRIFTVDLDKLKIFSLWNSID